MFEARYVWVNYVVGGINLHTAYINHLFLISRLLIISFL